MADFDSEDSLDGALIIDEPHDDSKPTKVEIKNESSSDVEIVEQDKNSDDGCRVFNVRSKLDPSPSTRSGTICKHCSRIFTTNNEFINHIRKYNGKNCTIMTNMELSTKRNKADDLTPEPSLKKKRGRLPKSPVNQFFKMPVPEAIPLLPQFIPIVLPSPSPPTNNNLPSLSKILIDELEPEYPCTKCGQIFRHNIGLICHMSSEHTEVPSQENIRKKSTKTSKNKSSIEKLKESKKIENNELIESDTIINLTLMTDLKKDSLLNRMKSYVYQTAAKDKVICILCNVNFKNIKKALAHVEDKHITEKIECGYCNMKFVYELKLRSHMAKRHKVIGVNKCDKCLKMINKEDSEAHLEKCVVKDVVQAKIKKEKNDS